jgi:hypothetical protein
MSSYVIGLEFGCDMDAKKYFIFNFAIVVAVIVHTITNTMYISGDKQSIVSARII